MFEIPDATPDPRFMRNPLVQVEGGIRFYAGMPLVTPGGAAIGTVCVVDQKPRKLDEAQRGTLAALARLTMNLLEARHRERELERQLLLLSPAVSGPGAAGAASHRTVAIFEVQDFAGAAARLGRGALEGYLDRLRKAFEAALRPASGDTVNRVSEAPELIVVLHGTREETAEPLQQLGTLLGAFEHDSGLRVLCAYGSSEGANERIETVYLRADEALTLERDAYRAALGTPV